MTRPDHRSRNGGYNRCEFAARLKEDREAIWQIFRAVVAGGDTYVFDPNISRRKALAYWLGPKTRCYVALSEQEIVGTYILKANQPGLGSHVANAGFMVSPSARGRGIGRAMAEHCLHEATRLGFRAMQFNFVVATNRTALRLWKNLGFKIVGRLPGAFRHTPARICRCLCHVSPVKACRIIPVRNIIASVGFTLCRAEEATATIRLAFLFPAAFSPAFA